MKHIVILSQKSFAQYKSEIGLINLYISDKPTVDFYTGNKHLVLQRDELSIPSFETIETYLEVPRKTIIRNHITFNGIYSSYNVVNI